MTRAERLVASCTIGLFVVAAPFDARGDACGPEPSASSAATFQRWSAWCRCVGGAPASNFNEAQRQGGCRRASDGSSFSVTPPRGASVGTIIGAGIGKALVDWLSGDPAADARKKQEAAAAAARQRAQEEAARAEALRQEELTKQRILGALKVEEPSRDLDLKDAVAEPPPPSAPSAVSTATPAGAAPPSLGGLQLKLGDAAETQGSKKPPPRGGARKEPKASTPTVEPCKCKRSSDDSCLKCCAREFERNQASCAGMDSEPWAACQARAFTCSQTCQVGCGMLPTPAP